MYKKVFKNEISYIKKIKEKIKKMKNEKKR